MKEYQEAAIAESEAMREAAITKGLEAHLKAMKDKKDKKKKKKPAATRGAGASGAYIPPPRSTGKKRPREEDSPKAPRQSTRSTRGVSRATRDSVPEEEIDALLAKMT